MLTGLRGMLRRPGRKLTASLCKYATFDMWPQPGKLCSSLHPLQGVEFKDADSGPGWAKHNVIRLKHRQAEKAEARAQAAQGGAVTAVRGARQAGARLRGKEAEVTLSDLHAAAEARLSGWSAWVASRNSMDESLQEKEDDTVRSLPDLRPCAKKSKVGASLFKQRLNFSAESAAACTVCSLCN